MDTDLLGRGFAFPLRVDASDPAGRPSGAIAASAGERKVRDSIVTILATQPGERLMRPTFGCGLKSLAFAPNTAATANLARFHVQDALARWEPRIAVADVAVANGRDDRYGPFLSVQVSYRIRATGAARSLAFQLPLAEG